MSKNNVSELRAAVKVDSLETILTKMATVGNPRVRKTSAGWVTSISTQKGDVSVELCVRSDFTHRTAHSSAVQCRRRLINMLNAMNVNTGELEDEN